MFAMLSAATKTLKMYMIMVPSWRVFEQSLNDTVQDELNASFLDVISEQNHIL